MMHDTATPAPRGAPTYTTSLPQAILYTIIGLVAAAIGYTIDDPFIIGLGAGYLALLTTVYLVHLSRDLRDTYLNKPDYHIEYFQRVRDGGWLWNIVNQDNVVIHRSTYAFAKRRDARRAANRWLDANTP